VGGLEKSGLLYLVGVLAGGVGVYLAYKWYEQQRARERAGRYPGVKAVYTPMGGRAVIERVSQDTSVVTYTSPSGVVVTVTVPAGSEELVVQELERGEIYYQKMLKEEPVYEIQPVPIEQAGGGVSPDLRQRLYSME